MLQIKNLSKKFGATAVLHNISCDIAAGTIGVFLGSSGTGKSTLLRIVAGLEGHEQGELVLNGKSLAAYDVGMVFQQFNLFENLTVLENITFSLVEGKTRLSLPEATERAKSLLVHYGLLDFAHRYPDELSGGQKQRLAIIRTIAQKPSVICFDEPTSALDPLLKSSVARTLLELAQEGYILLVATHDIQLVEQLRCMIFLMRSGSIVQVASSSDFAADPNNFSEIKKFMYHAQKK